MSRPDGSNVTNYAAPNLRRDGGPDVLDADMTRGDIVDKLKALRFSGGLYTLKMDGRVRDLFGVRPVRIAPEVKCP
jgi:hypothetical protein